MKNILLFTLLSFSFLQAQYTTPNQGETYTLANLANIQDSGVSLVADNTYQIFTDLTISQNDTFLINETTTLYIDEDVLITVFGTFYTFTTNDDILISHASAGLPYAGFRLEEGANISLSNTTFEYGGGFKILTENFQMNECTVRYMVEGAATGAALSFSRGNPSITGSTFYMNDLPAIASGANQTVAAKIINNTIEMNGQANENRPQINLSASGTQDTIVIRNNSIIGDRTKELVGGIAIANFYGNDNHVRIQDNTIRDNRYGLTLYGSCDSALVNDNLIEDNNSQDNPMQGGSGINLYSNGSNTIIRDNQINNNLWGITLQGTASANLGDGSEESPGRNSFSENGNDGILYALYNNTANNISAQNNCWIAGQESTADEVENVIFHQVDDSSLGWVDFSNFSCNMAVDDMIFENEITMYPNPAKDFVFIKLTEKADVEFYNEEGKCLLKQSLLSGENIIQLNIPQGMYFVKIQKGKQVFTKKLFIK